jgi:hypothetical protein
MTQRRITQMALLLLCGISLLGCPTERFRHETYKCNSGRFDIAEIILNNTDVGDDATIVGYGGEKKVEIKSSSRTSIGMTSGDVKIMIARETGKVTVKRGNRYAVLSCAKSVFTM